VKKFKKFEVRVMGKFWQSLATFGNEWNKNRVGFIYRLNRVTFGQKCATIEFCNGQKFEESPKSCHDWVKM